MVRISTPSPTPLSFEEGRNFPTPTGQLGGDEGEVGGVGGGVEEKRRTPTMARICGTDCHLPVHWQRRLHFALRHFRDIDKIHKARQRLWRFETCKWCVNGCYPECLTEPKCTDMVKLLRQVQPHRVKARSLLRLVYGARMLNFWLAAVDQCLGSADIEALVSLADDKTGAALSEGDLRLPLHLREQVRRDEERDDGNLHTELSIYDRFGDKFDLYEKAIDKFPAKTCSICGELKFDEEVCRLNMILAVNRQMLRVQNGFA